MSKHPEAGWIVMLLAMVLVTVLATVGYFAAPFDPAPNAEADTGDPGTIAAEHRIVGLRDDGAIVILDDRDGSLSEIVTPDAGGEVSDLVVGADLEAAFLGRPDGTIDLLRIKTGLAERHSSGRAVTVGPIAFPQLPRTVDRPAVEQMARVEPAGVAAIVVENITTGAEHRIERDDRGSVAEIEDLALSPFQNRLFGIADGGTALFRLEVDRAESLSQATVADAPDDVTRYLDITPLGDAVAAIVERPSGGTELVVVDRRTLEPTDVLFVAEDARLRSVDADATATSVLLTTGDGSLLELSPASGDGPRQLASGIVLAVW